MSVPFLIPNSFVNGNPVDADEHNENWVAVKSYVELLSSGTNIENGAITTARIANAAVTSAKIATNGVETSNINDDAVTTAKIADDAVTAAQIAAGAVGASELATDAVTTVKILDSNVTTAKIADSAITSAKIADGTIVNADVNASAAITYSKLAGVYTNGGSTNPVITISTSAPTGGSTGDVWFKY